MSAPTGPSPRLTPCRVVDAARAADVVARDRLAGAIDDLLPRAPLVRTIAARLLSRDVARAAEATGRAIAGELQLHRCTLEARIRHAGGASIKQLREGLVLVRLAAIVDGSRLPWSFVAQILGAPKADGLLALVHRRTGLPAGLWRQRARADVELEAFRAFLVANAPAWSTLAPPDRHRGSESTTRRRSTGGLSWSPGRAGVVAVQVGGRRTP